MKKHFTVKKILLYFMLILIVMQFFRIEKDQPEIVDKEDFINVTHPSPQIQSLLVNSCYDCHSYETVYPWYSNIAPVSWWLKHHVDEGNSELNFSLWGTYSLKKQDHKLAECVEMVQEKEMPLDSYTWIHRSSSLSQNERIALVGWFRSMRTFESEKK